MTTQTTPEQTMPELIWNDALTPEAGAEQATELFTQTFGYEPTGVWSAPGRVNIIGEHVDYNGGLCLPIALPHRAYVAVAPRSDREMHVVSAFGDRVVQMSNLDEIGPAGTECAVTNWSAYLVGVAWAFEQAGYGPLTGFDVALVSCVPQGGGLSSSAALECAIAVAIDEVCGLGLAGSLESPRDEGRAILVDLCRKAENDFAGANTGGLDQSASLRCSNGAALVLDCRDMSVRNIPFDLDALGLTLLVVDTRAPHSLADGQYGKRRAQCEDAACDLGVNLLVDVPVLSENPALPTSTGASDVRWEEILGGISDETAARRARHVISEIARTRAFVDILDGEGMSEDTLPILGALLSDSHESLRDDFEVSCPQLDVVHEVALAHGAIGARMTGGGFGGSAIVLLRSQQVDEVARAIAVAYAQAGWDSPHFMRATPSHPAGAM